MINDELKKRRDGRRRAALAHRRQGRARARRRPRADRDDDADGQPDPLRQRPARHRRARRRRWRRWCWPARSTRTSSTCSTAKAAAPLACAGIDGRMIQRPHARRVDSAMWARLPRVNPDPILDVLDKGYIPVVSTVGCDDGGRHLQHQRRHRRRAHRRPRSAPKA